MIWPKKRRNLVSLLFLTIGLGAFGTEQQTLLQHGFELHRVRSSLFLLHLPQISVRLEKESSVPSHQLKLRFRQNIDGPAKRCNNNRVRGPMARRLTTNQEIAGSIPAVLICFARHQESGMLHFVTYEPRALASNLLYCTETVLFSLLLIWFHQMPPTQHSRPASTHRHILRAKTPACSVLPNQ
jgi:hypothetical protein